MDRLLFPHKEKGTCENVPFIFALCKLRYTYLTTSFRALPALNAGTLLAGISISSPV